VIEHLFLFEATEIITKYNSVGMVFFEILWVKSFDFFRFI